MIIGIIIIASSVKVPRMQTLQNFPGLSSIHWRGVFPTEIKKIYLHYKLAKETLNNRTQPRIECETFPDGPTQSATGT